LVRINVAMFFDNVIFVSLGMHNFRDVKTLDLVFGDLIVASNNHIIYIFACEDH
jgi:hypothetical protein